MSLVLSGVCVRHGKREVVHGVDACAAGGRIVAVIGRNGSGKSSLVRAVAGVHSGAWSGGVSWNGQDLRSLSPRRRAAMVAYVPQHPLVAAEFTAREVVELAGAVCPRRHQDVDEAMESLGVSALASRLFSQLSGGERQRVVVARAFAQHDPGGLLVLDEPMSAMDLAEQHRVCRHLRRLADTGTVVLVVLHDLALADAIADDVWWLEHGKLRAGGAKQHVLTVAELQDGFGVEFSRPDGVIRAVVGGSGPSLGASIIDS